jgi:hypothetical protein
MARDKFMFFPNFKATADKLDDKTRLAFYDAITDYVFNDREPEDPIICALLEAIKPSLDKTDGRQNNGGNHNPKGVNQHSKDAQSGQFRSKLVNSGQFPSETETETETEERDITARARTRERRGSPLPIPTLEEVLEYAQQQNSMAGMGGFACPVDVATNFFNHYESIAWMLSNESRTPVANWKARLRWWVDHQHQFTKPEDEILDAPKVV